MANFYQYNGSIYRLTTAVAWKQAQAQAQSLGGNLVTVNNQAEQDWLVSTFGGSERLWTGLTDEVTQGQFKWASGETSTYTNWLPGQPDNAGNEDHVTMNWAGAGKWNDAPSFSTRGIIEIKFFEYNGSKYLLTGSGTWQQAQAQAQSLGGNLVTVNNQAEQDWLVSTFGGSELLWIGLTDQVIEGQFRWASGETSTYTNWNIGEPNNSYLGLGQLPENYVHMNWGSSGKWNDIIPGLSYRGIIEIKNTINGGDGNDTLNGNGDVYTLIGGKGDDTYIVDSTTDAVIENANEGTDTIQSSVTLTLATNVENLTLTGTAAINGTGNAANNVITGNSANNILNGGAGNDTLSGDTGNDIVNYAGSHTEFQTNILSDGSIQIKDNVTSNGDEGTDTLIGVEGIKFAASGGYYGLVTGGSGNDFLTATNGWSLLFGGAGNDTLNGTDGNDTLSGGAGNDILNGDTGYDIVNYAGSDTEFQANILSDGSIQIKDNVTSNGDEGTDTLIRVERINFAASGGYYDVLTGGSGNDSLTATNVWSLIFGGAGNDILNGGAGNDTLDGGAGTDTLIGGLSDDIYIVDSTTDTITENANEGIDTIQSSVTYAIAARTNIENLTLTGTAVINGTGNELNNVITGNSANNTLSGGAGNDTLDGGAGKDALIGGTGNDIYIVDSTTDTITELASGGTDTIQSSVTFSIVTRTNIENLTLTGAAVINGTGNAGNNVITGNSANNSLSGAAGNDTLDGGAGNDTLIGGTGNDIYIVDSTTDTITELASGGTDTIESSVTYTILAANVENLTLTGTAAINGTGNAANNVITGNTANNILDGGAGNDTLIGGLGDDIYIVDSTTDTITENANEGIDTIQSSVTLTLATNFENLTLTGTTAINGTGNAANNVITGNTANNILDGGAGNDTLIGGLGDDIYIVDSTTEIITENVGEGTDTIQSSVTLTLATNVENLTLTGTTAINGTGNGDNNVITGNAGNNTLDGGAGIDTLIGGLGDDIYYVDDSNDSITEDVAAGIDIVYTIIDYALSENIENLTLTGTVAIEAIGNELNNIITGNELSNVLDGSGGIDTLIGGLGDDNYVVDNTNDIITENANEGMDTVYISINYALSGNIENLTLIGTEAINGTGNASNNTITGNEFNNTLDGGAGLDTLIGGDGNDIYVVDSTTDTITENVGEGTDTIQSSVTLTLATNVENLTLTGTTAINGTGNAANNLIRGNAANNILDGGSGNDTLIGGLGDDIYIVDSTTDTITELASGGTDTIQSSVTLTIATNFENLTLTGTTAINGTGNAANNVITGNSANNILDGGLGTDTLIGGTSDDIYIINSTTDTITENVGEGTDTIQSSVTYTLATNVENLTLTGTTAINGTGNADNNVITGNTANNILDGGSGNDTLIGGTGNDIYIVDSTTDTITENANEGTDTIQSSVTYTILAANVENLTLTGAAAINGTGNAANNVITGNGANNTLDGGAGNDILTGGLGKDTLTGGLGRDRFDYRTLANSALGIFDVITDFNATTGNDLFLVTTARSGFNNVTTPVATLDATGIAARLTTAVFTANSAAQFTFGTRTFVAINDATAGFSATTDAIIEVTGLNSTLGTSNFTTTLA